MSFEDGKMQTTEFSQNESCGFNNQWTADTAIAKKIHKKKKKLKAMKKRLKNSKSVSKKQKAKYAKLKADYKKLKAKQKAQEQDIQIQMREMEIRYQKKLAQAKVEAWVYKTLLQASRLGKTNVGEMERLLELPEFLNGGDMNEQ